MRKWMCLAFAVLLTVSLGVPVSAAEGCIRVNTAGERAELYLVGNPEGNGYRLTDRYGGGYLRFDDTLSQALSDWLLECTVEAEALQPDESGRVFSDLEEGLYLVCSEADRSFPPFMVILPWDGYHWDVEVDPLKVEPPQTGDPIGAAILLMAASGAAFTALYKRKKFY